MKRILNKRVLASDMHSQESRNALYKKAFDRFGSEAHSESTIDELISLSRQVEKFSKRRKADKSSYLNLADKIAEVQNILEQTMHVYNIGPMVENQRIKKLEQLKFELLNN